MTRYVVVGAGAIGGMIGGRLAAAGVPTVVVGRGEQGRTLAREGVLLLTPEGEVRANPTVWLDPSEADLRHDDVLIVAIKTQDLGQALPVWADLPVRLADGGTGVAGDVLPVFLATNGVAAEDIAARWFARVHGICIWSPVVNLQPGVIVVRLSGISAVLHASRVPARLSDDTDRAILERMRVDFAAALIEVPMPQDVMAWKHAKLISNLANVVEAVLGTHADGSAIIAAAEAEARTVLAEAGVAMVPAAQVSAVRAAGPQVAHVPGAAGELGGSTWQSLMKGSATLESDYLNGEIVTIAHRAGLTAPVNAALARVGRRVLRQGLRPGALSAEQLLAEIKQS